MNFNFRFVLEKSFLLHFMQPAGHVPVICRRPSAGRPDRYPSVHCTHYLVKRYCQKTSDNLKQLL